MTRHHAMLHPIGLALVAVVACAGRAFGQEIDAAKAAAVKAGMVVNFVKYTRWPDASTEDEAGPIIVTIVGDSDIDAILPAVVGNQTSDGRSIEVRHIDYPATPAGQTAPRDEDMTDFRASLSESHLVYISQSEEDRLDDILKELKDTDVLTVSDIDRFAEKGGMLGLTIRDNRVAFDANLTAIKAAAFQISSQVLRLARVVAPQDDDSGGQR